MHAILMLSYEILEDTKSDAVNGKTYNTNTRTNKHDNKTN